MLLELKPKTSSGPDNLPNVFLRRYAEIIAKFLFVLFKKSLLSSKLPVEWKTARVVPIFKKGDCTLLQNYRPISLTSACCKMLEHIIAKHINKFLEEHSILSDFQHGFRKGYSTITQLVTIVHTFAKTLDMNGQIDAIFMDFSKAFDKVHHEKLIQKLKNINLPDILISWIQDYLTNRVQFVSVDGCSSSCLPVTSGVPQGSVLGPLLFQIYINDIVNVVTPGTHIRLFADDCVVFRQITCTNDQNELDQCLRNVLDWCSEFSMVLNTEKTVSMQITHKKNPINHVYTLGSSTLKQVNSYKYLGVTITSRLSWNSHIDNICSSAFKKLCFLRHKLRNSPSHIKLLTYNTYIRPKLEYASVVWDPFTKLNIDKLERVQRKAVRFIYSKFKITDSPLTSWRLTILKHLKREEENIALNFFILYLTISLLWILHSTYPL